MVFRRPFVESFLYALALLAALGLRFVNLGALPLTDFEASAALRALEVADGLKPAVGANPASVHLTAALFFVFGATNFAARFWPALAGTLLTLSPLFFRDRLGRLPALLLAFFLACDPALLALSRTAGSSILAVAAFVFAAAFWQTERRSAAAACAALALLAGPATWFGLFGLSLAWALEAGFKAPAEAKAEKDEDDPAPAPARPEERKRNSRLDEWRAPLGWGAAVLLFAGSFFLFSPKGLAGIYSAVAEFVSGWWMPSGVPVTRLLLALPAYALMPLLFGLAAVGRGAVKRDPLPLRLGLWALAAFLLALAYPARQVTDLAWPLLPLWTLAALELSRHFDFEKASIWEYGGVAALTLSLLVFGWMNLTGAAGPELLGDYGKLRLLFAAAALVLAALIVSLAALGWSADVARLGGVWAAGIALFLYTLGAATGAGGLRQPRTFELWNPSPQIADADLLLQTAENVSGWSQGHANSLPLVVSGVESPALLWLFREWEVSKKPALSPADSPALVVAPGGATLNLAASYRGEAFRWRQTPLWEQSPLPDWVRWLARREIPLSNETVILWVRSDLLLDSQNQPATP